MFLLSKNVAPNRFWFQVAKCDWNVRFGLRSQSIADYRHRSIRLPASGRGCVKTQIQKFKVEKQYRFISHWLNLWGLWIKFNGKLDDLLVVIPISVRANWFSHTLGHKQPVLYQYLP